MNKLLFLLIAILNYNGIKAQNSNQELKKVSQNLLFHFDKNSYTAGDSVQFKCYIINTIDHIQDDNNLFIILSDKYGKFISKDKYPIFNSSVHGAIAIPKDLVSGIYNIEAFTPYLINNKVVKINQINVKNTFLQADTSELLCHVYYNDNKLVTKVQNSFFVKTAYSNSLPAACEVFITDKENKEQYRFFTDLNGIGKITFMPLKNQLYNLNVISNNRVYKFPLIKPDTVGIDMEITCDLNIVNYKVIKNYQLQNNDDSYTLIIKQKDKIVYSSDFSFEKFDIITGGVRVENLHTGILNLSLVNKNGVTISTRSIYLQNNNDFENVQLKTSDNFKENKSQFDLSFSNKANKFFSIAVEETAFKDTVTANSNFDFFYTSTFKDGAFNQVVNFYEIHPMNKNSSQGYYKIITPSLKHFLANNSNNTMQPKLADEYATIIKGKVYDSKAEKLFTNGTINIYYNSADTTLNYNTKVNTDGSFVLDSLIFSGNQKFYYRYYDTKNNEIDCKIKIAENKNDEILNSLLVNNFNYNLPVKNEGIIPTDIKPIILEEVTTKPSAKNKSKSKKQIVNDMLSTGIFSGESSAFIDNINNPPTDGAMPVSNFIKNRIPNIAFQNGNLVNTKNFSLGSSNFWVIGVVIDETPAALSDLNAFAAKDIALIKFFDAGHVAAGMVNPGGIMAVYTMGKLSNTASGKTIDDPKDVKESLQEFYYKSANNIMATSFEKLTVTNKKAPSYWNPLLILRNNQSDFTLKTKKLEPGKVYKVSIKGYNELGQLINYETVLKN